MNSDSDGTSTTQLFVRGWGLTGPTDRVNTSCLQLQATVFILLEPSAETSKKNSVTKFRDASVSMTGFRFCKSW